MGNINLFVIDKMLEYLGLVGRFQNKIQNFPYVFLQNKTAALTKTPHAGQPQPGSTHTDGRPFRIFAPSFHQFFHDQPQRYPESSAKEFGAGFSAWRIDYY